MKNHVRHHGSGQSKNVADFEFHNLYLKVFPLAPPMSSEVNDTCSETDRSPSGADKMLILLCGCPLSTFNVGHVLTRFQSCILHHLGQAHIVMGRKIGLIGISDARDSS